MRHRLTVKKLDRSKASRDSLKRSLANSLILHERIKTTEAKAKFLKPFIEKLVTTGKESNLQNRRKLIKALGNPKTAHVLLTKISPRFTKRAGGYTRIIKLGQRQGDGARVVSLEFLE